MASQKKVKKLRIGVIVNREKPGAVGLLRDLAIHSESHPELEFLWETEAASLLHKQGYSLKHLQKKVELFIAAGGDGSLLATARALYPCPIPILGVNIGSLGFLTSLAASELIDALPSLTQRRWNVSPRLVLETVVRRGRKKSVVPCSLNDVVISHGAQSRLVRIRVKVGDSFVTEYVCDGLVISTPTGSTAYSVSAGGPMISPETEAFALTPICAHTLTNRSLVIGTNEPIRIEIPHQLSPLTVHFDGQPGGILNEGNELEIRRAKFPVMLAYTFDKNFYTILRQKLKWSGASV